MNFNSIILSSRAERSNLLAHIVIASEAKQSPRLARGLLRRCAPRNDTGSDIASAASKAVVTAVRRLRSAVQEIASSLRSSQ